MENDDVLAAFRLDAPLTTEEVEFLGYLENEDHELFTHAMQAGNLILHSENQPFSSQENFERKAVYCLLIEQLQKYPPVLSLATGAWVFSLRLALAVWGSQNEHAFFSLNNYAKSLYKLGRLKKAEPLLKQAWKQHIDILGQEHSDTLTSLNNYTECLYSLGRTQEAEPLLKQAWKQHIDILGVSNPKTLTNLTHYAKCLDDLGRINEAEPLFKQAWEQRIKVLGEKHQDTLTSLNTYAKCLCDLGRVNEADPLLKFAWEKCAEILGIEHPDTLTSLHHYAEYLYKQGDVSEAHPLLKQAWEKRKQILGENHPDTLKSLKNFAEFLHSLGRAREAEPLLERVWEQLTVVLGEQHPETLQSLINYTVCLDDLGRKKATVEDYLTNISRQLANNPLFTGKWSKLVEKVSKVFIRKILSGNYLAGFQHLQALSRAYVEVLDLQPPEQIEVIRTDFVTYHARYLDLCIKQDRLDLVPSIIAIIQGRKLAALVSEEIEQNPITDDDETAELKRQFLALRMELRQLTIGLQAIKL